MFLYSKGITIKFETKLVEIIESSLITVDYGDFK